MRDVEPLGRAARIGGSAGAGGIEPFGLALAQRRINGDLAGRDIEHELQSGAIRQFGGEVQALIGGPAEAESRM